MESAGELSGATDTPGATGVTVITEGQAEVGPDTGSTDLGTSRSKLRVGLTSAGASSSLSLMVITSSG